MDSVKWMKHGQRHAGESFLLRPAWAACAPIPFPDPRFSHSLLDELSVPLSAMTTSCPMPALGRPFALRKLEFPCSFALALKPTPDQIWLCPPAPNSRSARPHRAISRPTPNPPPGKGAAPRLPLLETPVRARRRRPMVWMNLTCYRPLWP